MAKVVFTPEAREDLKDIIRYTRATWGCDQAVEYVAGLRSQAAFLAETPEIGKKRDELANGLICFPYVSHVVYYTKTFNAIAVIRVLHQQQDPELHIGQGDST